MRLVPLTKGNTMKMAIELIEVPVSDQDISLDFYANKLGFTVDHDITVDEQLRFIQLTPPQSACSIHLSKNMSNHAPGSQKGIQVVIDDARKAHDVLAERGVPVSEVDPQPWGTFVYFADPDGNEWALQELPLETKQKRGEA